MNRQTELHLIDRILAHVAARTTDAIDTITLQPVGAYLDPARFEAERQRLFREGPVGLAHVSELATPGAFVTRDLAGLPVLLVRDGDGTLGAFLNVCRHRGAGLVSAPCGQAKAFACPYHAWTYGTGGELRGMPHEHGFADLPADRRQLVRLPVTTAGGVVFVSGPGGHADPALGPLADELTGLGLAEHHVFDRRSQVRALNWKLVFDIFLEAYHLRTAHRQTVYPMFLDNVYLVDRFAAHLRTGFAKRSIVELRDRPRDAWRIRPHTNLVYILFPSTLVLLEPDHADVLHVIPEAIDRTRVDSYTLVPEAELSDKARRYYAANNDLLYAATDEDYALGESIQRTLASGANPELCFGRFEQGLRYFHEAVDQALGRG